MNDFADPFQTVFEHPRQLAGLRQLAGMGQSLAPIHPKRVSIGCKWRPEPATFLCTDSGYFWQRNKPGELMSDDELRLQKALLKK